MMRHKQLQPRLPSIPAPTHRSYIWYLTSSSLWMAGISLQGFLLTWLLVGVLERPADEAGFARSLAEFPPRLMLLLGGLLGDRYNGRSYLSLMHVLVAIPPLLIVVVYLNGALSYWWVVAFGMLMRSYSRAAHLLRRTHM